MHSSGDWLWVLVLYHSYTFRLILTSICGHLTSCHVPTLVELMFCWRRQENKQINLIGGGNETGGAQAGRKELEVAIHPHVMLGRLHSAP